MDSLTSLATSLASDATVFIGNFLAFIVLIALLLIFALKGGRAKFFSLIISFYVGYALYTLCPFTNSIVSAGGTEFMKAGIAIVLYLFASFISYLVVRRVSGGSYTSMHFLPLFILTLFTAGFLMALAYNLFAVSDVYDFSKSLDMLFAPKEYFFWWFLAPLAALFVFAR
jgi:hypothetical protein